MLLPSLLHRLLLLLLEVLLLLPPLLHSLLLLLQQLPLVLTADVPAAFIRLLLLWLLLRGSIKPLLLVLAAVADTTRAAISIFSIQLLCRWPGWLTSPCCCCCGGGCCCPGCLAAIVDTAASCPAAIPIALTGFWHLHPALLMSSSNSSSRTRSGHTAGLASSCCLWRCCSGSISSWARLLPLALLLVPSG